MPLLVNHAKAVLLPKISTYIITLHQPTLQPSAVARPRVGVVPESVKLLIGVHYNITPLLLEPALSLLGADTLFPSCTNQPARHLLYPYKPLSLILGMRDIHSYPQARYFIPRLFSLPNCDLSVAAV